jgi:hypothetical protein
MRRGDAAHQSTTVTALEHPHEPNAETLGDLLRAVRAAVVGNDHLAGDFVFRQGLQSFADASRKRLGLIEAGHDDGHFRRCVARTG